MPQQSYAQPTMTLGMFSTNDPSAVTTATNENMAQVSSIAIGGTDNGVYTIQLESELGTFTFAFTASSATADEIADGLAAAAAADPDLLDLVDASSTSGTPLILAFLDRGVTWTVSFPVNPGSNMVETITTAAGATAIPLGRFVVTGSGAGFASLPGGSTVATDILGATVMSGEANVNAGLGSAASYPAGADMSLARVGEVVVYAEGAIGYGQPIYVRKADATASAPLGGVRVDADTSDAILLPGAVTRSATTGAGPIKVLLNLP